MLLIIGIVLTYLILTKFIFTVYTIKDIRAERISLKRKIIKYFFMIIIGWLIALLVLVGMAFGFAGIFLFEKFIDYPDVDYIDKF